MSIARNQFSKANQMYYFFQLQPITNKYSRKQTNTFRFNGFKHPNFASLIDQKQSITL